jgi:hypothetical protein
MIGMMMAVHAIEHLDRHCGMEWQACSLDQIEKLFAINPPNVAFGGKADLTVAAARSENSSCRWAPLS